MPPRGRRVPSHACRSYRGDGNQEKTADQSAKGRGREVLRIWRTVPLLVPDFFGAAEDAGDKERRPEPQRVRDAGHSHAPPKMSLFVERNVFHTIPVQAPALLM